MAFNIRRLLYGAYSKYFISAVLGLGLATLFRKVCNDRNCLVFYGPKFKEIDKKTFQFNEKCFQFEKKTGSCDKTKKIIPFA